MGPMGGSGAVNCAVNKAVQAAQTAWAEVCRLREPS